MVSKSVGPLTLDSPHPLTLDNPHPSRISQVLPNAINRENSNLPIGLRADPQPGSMTDFTTEFTRHDFGISLACVSAAMPAVYATGEPPDATLIRGDLQWPPPLSSALT